ncbi:MAG: NAD(P)H-binding protein [Bacteroidota bacterium]|nr:NAD(P)H-binding protein [Bacteroidota bacterium]MDP4233585.1 NAD(P)H-binding protein [Bacteroidota bacterium]MDP4243641.1 NAD(P)H-binding protein [Bacteroidota bacterium]MDP4287772.1 NAD(P)H-binding protein [Bacteroidota bacterium]
MKIFVAGASGFIGERVLDDLLRTGHDVTAHVHSDASLRALQREHPDLHMVKVDLSKEKEVHGIIAHGTEAVIYLPGVLRESKGLTFEGLHVDGVRNLLAEAKMAGVRRWIQMSALGVEPHSNIRYYDTKWRAEVMVRASGLAWTILRPSLIFDDRPRRQHNFVSEVAKAIRMAPFVPILGRGDFLMQPVSVDDVSQTIIQSLTKPETIDKTFELGGPEKLTYKEIVLRIACAMGSKKRAAHIPMWLILGAAQLLQRFSWFPITVDELTMLTAGNYIRDAGCERDWRATFELPMKRFDEAAISKLLTAPH